MPQKVKTLKRNQESFFWRKDPHYDSSWLGKFFCKFISQGRKSLIEACMSSAFIHLKFKTKKLPGGLLLEQIVKFRPVLSFVRKRMGRRLNPIPIPVSYRRQYILSIQYIVLFVKSIAERNFKNRIVSALGTLFETKRNFVTRMLASDVKFLADARFFSHLRWK